MYLYALEMTNCKHFTNQYRSIYLNSYIKSGYDGFKNFIRDRIDSQFIPKTSIINDTDNYGLCYSNYFQEQDFYFSFYRVFDD